MLEIKVNGGHTSVKAQGSKIQIMAELGCAIAGILDNTSVNEDREIDKKILLDMIRDCL